jgi:restriction system protein
MNAIDAVEVVLTEAGEPLGYREITRRILEHGLWQTAGLTPEATIHARLAVDIKDLGANSRFQRTGPGVFALRKWDLPEVAARGAKGKQAKAPVDESKPGDAQLPVAAAPGPDFVPLPKEEPLPLQNDKPLPKPSAALSFTDAAEVVLEQFGHKQPMHYKAITEKALAFSLVSTKGLTPEATLYAQVLTETRRRARRGEPPRFIMHGKGMIGLAKWVTGGLAFQIEQHNAGVRKKLLAQLMAMDPPEFEALIVELLVSLGFDDVTMTPASWDGGIDVRGTLVVGDVIRTRMAVQVKRWKRNVQAPTVQQVRGSLGTHEQGLIVTTSDFGKGARAEAERSNAVPVALMNGEQLVRLLVENDIGVHRTKYDLIELGEGE